MPLNAAVNRDTIAGLYNRLHDAKILQGSIAPRNILVQPGPLTRPRAERSFDNPSYRIIDFGRGEYYDGCEQAFTDGRMSEEQKKVRLRICNNTGEFLTYDRAIVDEEVVFVSLNVQVGGYLDSELTSSLSTQACGHCFCPETPRR